MSNKNPYASQFEKIVKEMDTILDDYIPSVYTSGNLSDDDDIFPTISHMEDLKEDMYASNLIPSYEKIYEAIIDAKVKITVNAAEDVKTVLDNLSESTEIIQSISDINTWIEGDDEEAERLIEFNAQLKKSGEYPSLRHLIDDTYEELEDVIYNSPNKYPEDINFKKITTRTINESEIPINE